MADKPEQGQEPSMEDILASIRRILSEDDQPAEAKAEPPQPAPAKAAAPPPPSPPPPPPPPPEPEPEEEEEEIDVAAMLKAMTPPAEPEPELQPEPEIALEDIPEPEPVPEPPAPPPSPPPPEPVYARQPEPVYVPEPPPPPPPPPQRSLSEDILELTQQMIAQPLRDMGAGAPILSQPAQQHSTDALQELARALLSKRDIAIGNRDMTLEGLIREILRPLLREWLDQNLPYLIERLVKKEIDTMVNRAERLEL
jgi:cell pole-organizing protein PopZ